MNVWYSSEIWQKLKKNPWTLTRFSLIHNSLILDPWCTFPWPGGLLFQSWKMENIVEKIALFFGQNQMSFYIYTLWCIFFFFFIIIFHQLGPLGRVGLVVTLSMCLSVCPLPMPFFCVVGLVQSVPCLWTGAILILISISSRALKLRMCSGVRSWSRSRSWGEP